MSLSALLLATEKVLIKDTILEEETCGIHEDGQPPPGIPDFYVSIYPTSWSVGPITVGTGLYEKYGISCTITWRLHRTTVRKQLRDLFIGEFRSIEKVARLINRSLDLNYELLNIANDFLHENRTGIIEPLRWVGTTIPPQTRDNIWLWSDREDPRAALTVTSNFVGAGRDQEYENVE